MVGLEFNTVLMPERWSDPHLHNPGRYGRGIFGELCLHPRHG